MSRASRYAVAIAIATLFLTNVAWAGSRQEEPPPAPAEEAPAEEAPAEEAPAEEAAEAVPEEPLPANEPPDAEPEAPAVAAKVLYQLAMTAYNEGRFFEAARGFDAAHAALPRPALLLNAARAWEQVGDLVRAAERFDTMLRDPDTPQALRDRAAAGYSRVLAAASSTPGRAPAAKPTSNPAISPGVVIEPGEAEEDPDKPKAASSEVEWFGIRLMGGLSTGTSNIFDADDEFRTAIHGELVFATMLWKHVYWDIARIGTGVPLIFTWGMAAGYRHRWGVHEVRAGLHITNYIILPTLSGVEAAYLYDVAGGMKLELGARLMAWPTTIVATAGLKF